jgi:hypothetical protein
MRRKNVEEDMEHELLPNIPIGEDEFVGEVVVATVTDDATDELDILLGKSFDVDRIVSRVHEPSRTPIDFAKLASVEDLESFDASENILDDVETPEIPTYVAPPQRVEKGALDHELRKAARKPATLTAWIKAELARGSKIEDLVAHARASDEVVARDIEGCYLMMNEPAPTDED